MLGRRASWWGALIAFPILVAWVGLASAQAETGTEEPPTPDASRDAEARGLFEAGRAAFADGRFEDALRYFRQSYELSHRGELLYNVGSAADRLQREDEALAAFEEYLRVLPEAANRREVEGRIRVLRDRLERERAERAEREAATARADDPLAVDAASAPVVDPLATSDAPQDHGSGVENEWWFWTLVGVGVAGAAVLTGVLVATSQETRYPPYVTGDEGAIAFTLTLAVPAP